MAGWGIGLGSFVNGMQSGYGIGQRLKNDKLTGEMNEIKLQDMQRTQKKQGDLDALGKQGGADFNAAVSGGQADPAHPDEWFSKNYAPKMESFFLAQNDLENASKWSAWSQDAGTKKQIKTMGQLIGQYHDSAATGDFSGFKGTFGKFYNDLPNDARNGSKFKDMAVNKDEQGNINGITATFDGADGKPITHSWNDLPSFQQSLQAWANPTVLYQQTMKDQEAGKKFKSDIGMYAAKKGIDLRHANAERAAGLKGKTPQERYSVAQETLTKASVNGQPPTDAQVRSYLKSQDDYASTQTPPGLAAPGLSGPIAGSAPTAGEAAPAAPTVPKVIVNQKTGKVVPGDAAGAPTAQAAAAAGKPLPMPADPASITAPAPSSAPAAQQGSPAAQVSSTVPGSTSNSAARMYRAQNPLTADEQQALAENARAPGIVAPAQQQQHPNLKPVVPGNIGTAVSAARPVAVTMQNGRSVLVPTVIGGQQLSPEQAIQRFKQTGQHLGIFANPASANAFAQGGQQAQPNAGLGNVAPPGIGGY